MPIAWEELTPQLRSDAFNVSNVPSRLERLKKDPWAELFATKQSVTKSIIKWVAEASQGLTRK